jgi:hypothetical protein
MSIYQTDLRKWLMENNCLETIRKYKECHYPVYLVDIKDKTYFIKKLVDLKEYKITKDLETLELPTFQKSKFLLHSNISIEKIIQDPCELLIQKKKIYYYMVSEEIKGTPFLYELQNINKEDLENILNLIFFSLGKAWSKLGFVHLDLHLENIILQKIDRSEFFKGNHHYLPIIIDFDRSITKTNMNPEYQHKTIFNDIWKLLGILSIYLKNEKGEMILDYIELFIDRHEFQERKEEFVNLWFNVLPYDMDICKYLF